MIEGYKCLLTCRCFLPQFKNRADPPTHQFIAFVVLQDDVAVPKIVQCNNCGVLHKIVDVCKSEIQTGRESGATLVTIDDIKMCLGTNLVTILENNAVDLPTWEQVQFIVENEQWGNHVVLKSEIDDKTTTGKILRVLGTNLAKVESFMRDEVM